MRKVFVWIHLFLFFGLPIISLGQLAEPKFHKLFSANALPNNSVLAITQDSSGFMWFGTNEGLCRYDGASLFRYSHNSNDTLSISSNGILSLLTDKKGNLWVGTENGLNLYNQKTGSFKRFHYEPTRNKRVVNYVGTTLFEDIDSNLWVGTTKGLFKKNSQTNSPLVKIMELFGGPSASENDLFHGICQDKTGNVWAAAGTKIYKFSRKGKMLERFNLSTHLGPTGKFIKGLAIDPQQRLWIGGNTGSLILFNCVNHSIEKVNSGYSNDGDKIHQILFDKSNHGLLISGSNGVAFIDQHLNKRYHYKNNPDNTNSLNDNIVMSIFKNKDGIIWLGTYNSGVSYIFPNENLFKTITAGSINNLSYNVVSSISKLNSDHLLLGTSGGGLNILNLKTKKASLISSLTKKHITTVITDRNGDYWVGTDGNGLSRLNVKTNKWQHYQNSKSDTNTISSNVIYKLLEDHQGKIWLATLKGLDVFDRKTESFSRSKVITDSLPTLTIFEDSKRNLWLAKSKKTFLFLPNGSNKAEKVSIQLTKNTDPTLPIGIWAINEDENGTIWAGGFSSGLMRYNPKTNVFENFECKGFPNIPYHIQTIESDQQGKLWLGMMTNDLVMVDVKLKNATHFNYLDGIEANEFIINSSLRDEKNTLYFGSNKGLVYFPAHSIKLNMRAPKVAITSLEINDQAILTGDSTQILTQQLQYTDNITLSYDQNFFKIGFSLLNYIHPEKNTFEYKLDNTDQWRKTSDPWVTFNNMAPGTYQLHVRGYNNDNVMSTSPAKLTIVINSPWYQTWWAYLFYTLIVLGILGTIIRLFWIKASYSQALHLNKCKLDFFTNISHEIRTHLALIIVPLEKIEQNMNVQSNARLAQNNTNKLLALVTELMDFRKLESDQTDLHVQELDIVATVQSQLANFDHLVQQKQLVVSLTPKPERIMAYFDDFQMSKAISNLLSNAFKFVDQEGNVEIIISEGTSYISLKIIDDGKGIAPEHIDRLFDNYFQVYEYGDKNTGYGIGLPLSKGIVALHHGTLTASTLIDSATQKQRTCFEITLLKGSTHFTEKQLILINKPNDSLLARLSDSIDGEFSQTASADAETILIAEDNPELSQFIASCFPQYHIIQCHDGLTAWEQSIDILPDLVITDIMMPGMRGTELCKKLKQDERTSHIPVVMLTAMVADSQMIEGLEAQADHYITKPFNTKELELKVINLLNLQNVVRARAKAAKNLGEFEEALTNEKDREFVNKLSDVIESNISDPDFGVDELAREMGIGRTVFYKKVKAATGMSVNEFVKIIRLNYAAKLLRADVYPVNEVAQMVGFNDRRYFTKEFSRIIGKTPSLYAKEFKKSE